VKVEKTSLDGVTKVLAGMSEGASFGEMSVLTQGKVSATIRAEKEVETWTVESEYLYKLFKTEPGMRQRFFKSASLKLAAMLRDFGSNKPKEKKKEDEEEEEVEQENKSSSKDKEFVKLFNCQ